jgi:hypothetical protein
VATKPIELMQAARGAAIAALTCDEPLDGEKNPVTPQRRAIVAERLQDTVERQMAAVERVLAVIGPADAIEAEGSARTLANIARIIREIAALNLTEHDVKEPHDANDADARDDAIPRDLDEFRRELARRLQALIDVHEADAAIGAQDVRAGHVERRDGNSPD